MYLQKPVKLNWEEKICRETIFISIFSKLYSRRVMNSGIFSTYCANKRTDKRNKQDLKKATKRAKNNKITDKCGNTCHIPSEKFEL